MAAAREAREAAEAHRQRQRRHGLLPVLLRDLRPGPARREEARGQRLLPVTATPTRSTSGSAPRTASPRSTTRSTGRASSSWPTASGASAPKWCSGCHDPVVLFTGQMGAATQAKFSYDSWEAQQGLTCMSCHSIAEVKDIARQRRLRHRGVEAVSVRVLEERDALQAVNRLLIRMEPSLHRKTFMKPFHRGRRSSARRATRSR